MFHHTSVEVLIRLLYMEVSEDVGYPYSLPCLSCSLPKPLSKPLSKPPADDEEDYDLMFHEASSMQVISCAGLVSSCFSV